MGGAGSDGPSGAAGTGTGHGGSGFGGFATGGIVDRLMVPQGEDGLAALRLGEGVVDQNTMKILSNQIRSGNIGGGETSEIKALLQKLISAVNSGNFHVAKNTLKTAKVMQKFDLQGLPEARGY